MRSPVFKNEAQRALEAAKIAVQKPGRPNRRQKAVPTTKEAADHFNVSERSVRRARRLLESGSAALVRSIERGKVSLLAAEKEMRGAT